MLNTEEFYSKTYCKRIDDKQWRHQLTPGTVNILYNHFKPASVIDVGCANGLHLKAFKSLGVEHLFGIEGTPHWAPYIEKYFDNRYLIADLRQPLPSLNMNFDIVISFEVLEHLEEDFVIQVVKNLISLGNTLCASASPSGGGFYHLNVKPRRYWINLFESLGMSYHRDEVDQLQTTFRNIKCSQWFKTGLMVFRKVN